ncbi:NAD(P)H-dependent oxidoreductase [Nocardiopsis sp. ATB16-24]|uniref:NADPH-dependent FMN reductase n=1 Tax=Nocardiopsis sp. ATB16-24 TaxID=3019555 RepID=UPI002557774D|nr:NAD(P)H-dependent oxidoreductase [Nocardiopsis sp. ATB16-24]
MISSPLSLSIIIGSVRSGRFGSRVGNWFAGQAANRTDLKVDIIDLIDHTLPLTLPNWGEEPPEPARTVVARLSERLQAADAFVVITPEYNHSYPASLKNLIDWYRREWVAKPIGLVSYGGVGGGIRASEHLRQVFAEMHAMTVRETLSFHNAWNDFDAGAAPEGAETAANTLLNQLVWWADVLREARSRRPYCH